MIPNHYVGEVAEGVDFDALIKSVKEEARTSHFQTDNIKAKNNEGLLRVQCNGDVANIFRKRKEIVRFRCDKVGAEHEKEKECVKEKA